MLYDFTRRLGHIVGVTSLLILLEFSRAFSPRTNQPNTIPANTFDPNDALRILNEAKTAGIDIDVDINLDKAREFASHYGKYSYEEVQHVRNGALDEICSVGLLSSSGSIQTIQKCMNFLTQ